MNFKEHLLTFLDNYLVNNILDAQNNKRVLSFKLNIKRIENNINIFEKEYKKDNYIDNCYYYDDNDKLGISLLFNAGAFYIQDSAAMFPASILNIKDNDIILDMCAAPGGKTYDITLKSNNTNIIVSNEIDYKRAGVLSSNIEKYGFDNVIVINNDPLKIQNRLIESFDKIILDAPCSGSAMFRKNDEALKLWSYDKVIECSKIQKNLIEASYNMLKKGGELIYSTCSFSIEENEYVIKEFLDNHPDMKIIPIEYNKYFDNTINIKGGLRLYPHKYNGEGQVMFHLIKDGTNNKNNFRLLKNNNISKLVFEFLDSIKYIYKKEDIIKIGNNFYHAPFNKIDLSFLNILRYGVLLGNIEKDRFIPDHNLATAYNNDKGNIINLDENEAKDYYKGLTLNLDYENGYYVVRYKNNNLGFVKIVNKIGKNHLPKGLRH